MSLKDLNNEGLTEKTINTGYYIFINYTEVWSAGIYHNIKTEFYVSSLGRVYNKNKNSFSKLYINDSGYLYVQSRYKGKRTSIMINRLVAESFFGEPPKNMKNAEADHINKNLLDNSIYNLRWLTQIENLNNRNLHNQKENSNSNNKYSKELIIKIANKIQENNLTLHEISNYFNIPYTTVVNIKNKNRWKDTLSSYDFSKYKNDIPKNDKYSDEIILNIANMIIENKKDMQYIANINNVSYSLVYLIKKKKIRKDLLEKYDFSGYNKVKNKFNKNQLKIIDSLILQGLSPKEICIKLNLQYDKKIRMSIYDRKRNLYNKK